MAWRERQRENERSQKEKGDTPRTGSSGFEQCAAVVCRGTPPSPDQHISKKCHRLRLILSTACLLLPGLGL